MKENFTPGPFMDPPLDQQPLQVRDMLAEAGMDEASIQKYEELEFNKVREREASLCDCMNRVSPVLFIPRKQALLARSRGTSSALGLNSLSCVPFCCPWC